MKQTTFWSNPARRALQVAILAAALTLVGCDNDVNFNPVAPAFPSFMQTNITTAGPGRSLEIFGSLRAEAGSCLEATVLYDGKELAGARTRCRESSGCAKLELRAHANSTAGHHTVSFRVLSQSPEIMDYTAEGKILTSREGIAFEKTTPLDPIRATLRPGESVTFDVDFFNFEN